MYGLCIYVCMHAYKYIRIKACLSVNVYMYVCMYVCMYVWVTFLRRHCYDL